MSNSCVVKLLGIGSISLQFDGITYYIDSFNDYNEPPNLNQNDVVLFTHDDKDHFLPIKLSSKLQRSNVIIGPPSIGLPLLAEACATKEQICLHYPVDGDSPTTFMQGSATIKVFRTEHFLDWHAIHISYLIEVGKLKIYITGDSNLHQSHKSYLEGIDCMIVSLLNTEITKGFIPKKHGALFSIVDLLKIQYEYKPRMIIGNHLINCDWAVNPIQLSEMVKNQGIDYVQILCTVDDEIQIKEYV